MPTTRRRIILLLWAGLMGLGLWLLQGHLQLDHDMDFFLPPSAGPLQQQVLEQLREGEAARILIVTIRAAQTEQAARLSRALQQALVGEGHFSQVLNRPVVQKESSLQDAFAYRYLLRDTDWQALHPALQQRLEELASPLAAITRQTLAKDPTASYRDWLDSLQGDSVPALHHGVWFDQHGRALLLLRTHAPGMALDQQAANLQRIEQAFAGLAEQAGAELQMGGIPALAVASRETIRSEATTLSIAASLLVALILLWAYRSWRLWLLAALPLGSAVVVALLVVWALFGQVHGITLAFGITLIGVALDYPLHLFSHLRQGQAPQQALAGIWPTLRLGVLSTALGYLAMVFSGFDGLVQLGSFAASGLLTAALVTRWVLPAALPVRWSGPTTARWRLPRPGAASATLRYAVVGGVLLLSLSWLLFSPRPLWQQDVAALSPIPESLRQQEGALRQALGLADPNHLLLIEGASAEAVLQRSESLLGLLHRGQQEGWLQGFEMAAQWLPSEQRQRERQQALPDPESLRAWLVEAQAGLPFREGGFEPFVSAVQQSKELSPLRPEGLDNGVLAARIAPLLFVRDGRWWAQVPLSGVQDAPALRAALAGQSQVYYLDLARDTGAMLDQFRHSTFYALLAGAVLIALLLRVGLGSWRACGRVLLPVGAALLATLGLLHLAGQLISLFHLVALLLVLGIGIDYSLFFARGGNTQEQDDTGHALALCAISSLSVFVILASSQLPVLHAIGATVALGILSSFCFAWLLSSVAGTDNNDKPCLHTS